MEEFSFINWIKEQQKRDKNIAIDIGDDCASIKINDNNLFLITSDMLVEGTHFDLKKSSAGQVGRKSIACSISDIAAMGCIARYAVVSLCFHQDTKTEFAKELYLGMQELANEFDIKIIGGDVVSTKNLLAINVTMLGENRGLNPVTRASSRVDDALLVTGTLGGSIVGKHLTFTPRLREGLILNKNFTINAMIDISDGLVADLQHILVASGTGAELYEDKIPVSSDAERLSRNTGRNALDHALHDGEDYELLFTLSEAESEKLLDSNFFSTRLSRIGRIKKDPGIHLHHSNGEVKKIVPMGYEHFKGK
ncbi:MAG: thiamine-monophosphate kinase [Candidatus Scalindua sp. AMX11]|nr:MAG: thiamine-monophosphate kinase [Candidatus Scalindua sp.]NOG85455.1 thiamine-monophosphate kinase [Planctomycetota bacterium]RZV90293.1 MAG: thiamine-monophosphate kinase [Candidatus Scalindua sp. SCAELEC01]TDE64704.1 MAG: thiamine-monophosphate kinase [Candidatus Scalindua sp. AMX11]GJQ60812.1 MAG: thiamine-monophosphate kinase [Candidatus Scalindua sp.]